MMAPRTKSLKQSRPDFLSSIPNWILGAAGAILLISTITGLLLPTALAQRSSMTLQTLATVQASGFGIILSVTVLGVQLIATRYSPRMAEVVTDSVLLRFSLVLISVSIGLDIFAIQLLPIFSQRLTIMVTTSLIGGALVAGLGLYLFVSETLTRSTPSGLVTAYVNLKTPEEVWRWASERTPKSAHPLGGIFGFITAAIRNQEFEIAEIAIREYRDLLIRIIESLVADNHLRQTDDVSGRAIFQTPFQKHLPRIAESACRKSAKGLAENAVDAQENVGIAASNASRGHISVKAMRGARSTQQKVPLKRENAGIHRVIGEAHANILNSIAEIPDPGNLSRGLSSYQELIRVSLLKDIPDWTLSELSRDFYRRGIDPSLETFLDHYDSYLDSLQIDWSQTYPPDDRGESRFLRTAFEFRRRTFEATLQHYYYYENNGEFVDQSPTRHLIQICETAVESNAERFAAEFFRGVIDCGFIEYQLGDSLSNAQWHRLSRIQEENPRVAQYAFAASKEHGVIPPLQQWINQWKMGKQNREGIVSIFSDDEMEYDEWIDRVEAELRNQE